jgi:hypothetical protein
MRANMLQPAEPEADILANTHNFQANVRCEHATSVLKRAVFVLALGRHGNYNPACQDVPSAVCGTTLTDTAQREGSCANTYLLALPSASSLIFSSLSLPPAQLDHTRYSASLFLWHQV